MKKKSRILVLIAALALIGAYLFPLWKIDLDAPQYPEGLGMKICISSIAGDIHIINGLNHYIGMKIIEPDSIPELSYMPYILAGLILFGLIVAAAGNKKLLYVFAFLFLVTGIVGGVDFYMWEYDYGHDLNPHAAIKVPGMTYQPPLWGTKQLLNFTAYSYPDIGGYIVLIAGVLIVLIAVWEMFSKVNLHPRVLNKKVAWAHVILILFLFNSCSSGPDPLKFGIDGCDYCKMIIMNDRYGAEAITKKGKVYKFDSIECMANYIKEHPGENNYANLLTLDYMQPGKFIDAKNAVFVLSEDLPSPMGLNLTSFQTEDAVNTLRNKVDGKMLKWEEVTQLVAEEI